MIRVYSGYGDPPIETLLEHKELMVPSEGFRFYCGICYAKIGFDGEEHRRFVRWWPSMCPAPSDAIEFYSYEALKIINGVRVNWKHFKLQTDKSVTK